MIMMSQTSATNMQQTKFEPMSVIKFFNVICHTQRCVARLSTPQPEPESEPFTKNLDFLVGTSTTFHTMSTHVILEISPMYIPAGKINQITDTVISQSPHCFN